MARRGKAGVNWKFDTLTPTLAAFTVTANVAVAGYAKVLAEDILQWMKTNAPWEDRTGDARNELWTDVQHQGFKVLIHLGHGVEYGIWLEVRWNGVYAIIVPALEHYDSHVLWGFFDGMIGEATRGRGRSML